MKSSSLFSIPILRDLVDFFIPRYCIVCGERLSSQEQHLCLSCLSSLPRTNYHIAEYSRTEQVFWGRIPIEKSSSFFFYDAQNVRKLILSLKYESNPYVGIYLSRVYAREILPSGFFDGIDAIVPVPLAWKRLIKRGYNQSFHIAEGISLETGIPILDDVVRRNRNNETQTHLSHVERQENVAGIFTLVCPEKVAGKHLLIVDDVMTTGATIVSLCETLMQAHNVRFSVLTLALAGMQKGMPEM